jgi:hypothetical protein
MTTRGPKTKAIAAPARWMAMAALASVCAVALSACEENGPATSSEPAAAAPAQGPSDLMGAPPPGAGPEAGPPSTRTPEYVPPGATAYPPPPGGYPAQPPGAPGYAPPQSAPPSGAPTEVIAMAPIPNPPEEPRHSHHWRPAGHHHHGGWWGPVFTAKATSVHHGRHHDVIAVAHPARPAATAHHGAATAAKPALPPGAQLPKPQAPHAHQGPDAGTVAAASGGSTSLANNEAGADNAVGNGVTPQTPEDPRYDALQAALSAAVNHEAILNAPRQIQPGQTADVTLTIPSDYAQILRTEAAKQNLSDQAASANLEATLVGDGYTIVPNETQALPLTLGAATVFHWKVTPQGATQGPLRAELHINLLASNHMLNVGPIKTANGTTGRIIGVGLLVLIAAVLLGWVMRTRRRPAPRGASKPRANHQSGNPPTL